VPDEWQYHPEIFPELSVFRIVSSKNGEFLESYFPKELKMRKKVKDAILPEALLSASVTLTLTATASLLSLLSEAALRQSQPAFPSTSRPWRMPNAACSWTP
jgi:hypothetical protein